MRSGIFCYTPDTGEENKETFQNHSISHFWLQYRSSKLQDLQHKALSTPGFFFPPSLSGQRDTNISSAPGNNTSNFRSLEPELRHDFSSHRKIS